MPEGDSYTFAARRVRPLLAGRRVTGVEGSSPSVRRRSEAILDQVVASVRTRGKNLLIDLDSGMSVRIHLGMSGRVLTTPTGSVPSGGRGATRLALTTDLGKVWVLGAPTVEVERRRVIDHALERLGPDLLGADFDMEAYLARAGLHPQEATLSEFLLDQRVMAGVGNEYKSEILFLEGLAPDRRVGSLAPDELRRLAKRARALLLPNADRAVRSTSGRPNGALWVYGRAGLPCRRCHTAIAENWIGAPPRVTYWCQACQH